MSTPSDSHLRDHLFISYAWEDVALAEWLTLKLTAEGYRVWCDRFKLLGGESYPHDIDLAIKEQTFRLLALLSHASIDKPNPRKERTLALNIARERKIDFLIPLNVDGLRPTELDWMQSDLTFIPFEKSWAEGLAQLLKKLRSIDAPRTAPYGRSTVTEWYATHEKVADTPERLWTNLLPIAEFPTEVIRLDQPDTPLTLPPGWPAYSEGSHVAWVLEAPSDLDAATIRTLVSWDAAPTEGSKPRDVLANLIRQYLRRRCMGLGLAQTAEGELYFPPELLDRDRLPFTHHTGRRTYVQAVGQRTFRRSQGRTDEVRYHLSALLIPRLDRYVRPVVELKLRVYLTDMAGHPLPARLIPRRRKKICQYWFNHQWWSRAVAVAGWFGQEQRCINLALTPDIQLIVDTLPLTLTAPVGIIEPESDPDAFQEPDVIDEDALYTAEAPEDTNDQ